MNDLIEVLEAMRAAKDSASKPTGAHVLDETIKYIRELEAEREEYRKSAVANVSILSAEIARLQSIASHMTLARAESGCPEDETLVAHLRNLKTELAQLKSDQGEIAMQAFVSGVKARDDYHNCDREFFNAMDEARRLLAEGRLGVKE